MRIGVNLYGLGKAGGRDFERTAKQLAAFGYGSVEPLVMLSCDRNAMEGQSFVPLSIWQQDELTERSRMLKERYNMRITTCHFGALPGEDISAKTDSMIEIIQTTDVRDFVLSRMLRTESECLRDAEICSRTAEKLAPYGGRLLYHNHESEFAALDGGVRILDRFLSLCRADIGLELDVGWVMFAGADPVAVLERYRNRVARLHLKDFHPGFTAERRERDIVAVGTGALPLENLLSCAAALGLREDQIIVDQDCSGGDLLTDLGTGIAAVNALLPV